MADYYNLTNLTADTGLLNFVSEANNLVDGLLGVSILIILFVILFVQGLRYGSMTAFASATFFVGIAGIIFIVTGFIAQGILIYPILIMAIVGGFLWIKGSNM